MNESSNIKSVPLTDPAIKDDDEFVKRRFWMIDYPLLCYLREVHPQDQPTEMKQVSLVFKNLADTEAPEVVIEIETGMKFLGFVD